MRLFKLKFLLSMVLTWSAPFTFAGTGSSYGGFTFSSDIPKDRVILLKEDIDFLYQLPVMSDSYGLQQMTEMKAVSGPDLHHWILNRLRIFIPEEVDPGRLFALTTQSYDYQNVGLLPKVIRKSINSTTSGAGVLASNVGGLLYIKGKLNRTLGMATVNGKTFPILSPRVGIIQIANSYFENGGLPESEPKSMINRLLRIGTLFHEARHSDGNGTSLGFLHELCPQGHPLAGVHACDKIENGSYGLEARLHRVISRNCAKCTSEEVEVLRLMSLEYFGRLVLSPPVAIKAEKFRQELNTYKHILQLCKSLEGREDQCPATLVKQTNHKYNETRIQLDYFLRTGNGSKPSRPIKDAQAEGFFQDLTLEETKSFMNP